MTNINEIHRKLTIVRQEEEEQQQHQQTNSLDRDHYVANGQKDRKKTTEMTDPFQKMNRKYSTTLK